MKAKQFISYFGLGIIFWYIFAKIVNVLADSFFIPNSAYLIWIYVIAIPLLVLSIVPVKYIIGKPFNQLLKPVTIMTYAATMADGIAFAWFPELYSSNPQTALLGAAWILWGAGWGMAIAHALEFLSNKESQS